MSWVKCSDRLPSKGHKIEWISPSYEIVKGNFIGGCVWMPDGSNCYVYYLPLAWRSI